MLKIAIENSYLDKSIGKDDHGANVFMQNMFLQHNIQLVRVSINKFDRTKNHFIEYYSFDSTGKTKRINKPMKPDVIRSRRSAAIYQKHHQLKSFVVVPSEKIALIANDKYETYMFLKKYQPLTYLLSTFFIYKKVQSSFKNQIVIKPIRANGGKGIKLTTVDALLKQKKKYEGLEELYIVQDFKDFTQGYKGITDGNHDVRFMFAGKKIIEITLRVPEKGNFKSNLGSGGKQFPLMMSQIPISLRNTVKKIYKDLQLEGNDIFSMDLAYCAPKKKWYLIEINSSPGTRYYQEDKIILKPIVMGFINFFKKISNT